MQDLIQILSVYWTFLFADGIKGSRLVEQEMVKCI
jgi:hypothetical protein